MAFHLWGIDPQGKPSAYIGHINHGAKPEWEAKALSEGWTDLRWSSARDSESSSETESTLDPDTSSAPSRPTRKARGTSSDRKSVV